MEGRKVFTLNGLAVKGRTWGSSEIKIPEGVQIVDLQEGRLTDLTGIVFPEGVTEIYLSFNKLTNLRGAVFPKSLTILTLNHNEITTLDGAVFPDNLETLNMYMNPIVNLAGVKLPNKLEYFRLGCISTNVFEDIELPDGLHEFVFNQSPMHPSVTFIGIHFPENLECICFGWDPVNFDNVFVSPRTYILEEDNGDQVGISKVRTVSNRVCARAILKGAQTKPDTLQAWAFRLSYWLGGVAYEEVDGALEGD